MKRKLLSILALFCLTVTSVWAAQPAVTNVVTQDNFYSFFDADGNLLETVESNELIFQGEFSGLVETIIIPDGITLTGDDAVLNNIALSITGDDVTVTGFTLKEENTDFTNNDGAAIYVSGSDVILDGVSVTYNAPSEVEAKAIFANGADNFKLINSEIIFSGANPGENHYRGLEVSNCDAAKIDNNTISAEFPAVPVDYNYFGTIGQDLVLAVGIQGGEDGGEDIEFTNNIINVNTNGAIDDFPTIDAVMIHSTDDILIKGNNITLLDTTPEDSQRYYNSLYIDSTTGTVEANDIILNTTTADDDVRAGYAYAFQGVDSEVNIVGNNITSISNGPNIGISVASGWGVDSELIIKDNFISVTGSAPSIYSWQLVSGIEILRGDAKIYNNTIYTYNANEYQDGAMYGISNTQGMYGDLSFDIQNNTVYTEGEYAISVIEATSLNVVKNILIAQELFGDDAVYIKSGDNNTVEDNLLGYVIPKTGVSTYEIPANVSLFKVLDDGGQGFKYSPGCAGTLTLTAPMGYRLQLSGNIKTEIGLDYLTVYDGSDDQADILIDQMSSSGNNGTSTDIPTVTSTGQSLTFCFHSDNKDSGDSEFDGLDLTVTVINETDDQENVVTQDNFYSFFDEYGNLLDDVEFDKLIFQGEFSDLASYITLDRPITITGDNAVLKDIGFIVTGEGITLDNMTLDANSDLGYLIDIAGENAVIQNMDITYVVDEAASAITVRPYANGVKILNNNIYFESTVDDYAADEVTTAICVNSGVSVFDEEDPIEGLVIDGNKITAVIPAFQADVYENEYYVMGLSAVNGVRINGAEDFIFTNDTLSVTTNRLAGTTPTLQALYVASSSGLIDGNVISMNDTFTPAGKDIYIYAVELINDEELTISNNDFNISTTGGKVEAGAAYAITAIASEFEVTGNNITTVSNGPNLGIYLPTNMGLPCDAVITDNIINVTGLATSEHNTGLVSGIEIETGDVEIKGNTIFTYNIGEYAEGNYIYGINNAQDSYYNNKNIPNVEITDNIVITEGHYAISFLKVEDAEITDNILCAHELTSDDAVHITLGDGNIVVDNLHDYVMPKTGEKTYNIPANVSSFKVYDYGGPRCKYSPDCAGTLTLTAPEGYLLQLSGNIMTEIDDDYLTVYDGSNNEADVLINQMSSPSNGTETAIETVTSTGQSLTLYFQSDNKDSDNSEFDGLDLTVTLIDNPFATNIVTQDNFYNFFDEYGTLLDDVPFDELIFQGKFSFDKLGELSNLPSYITIGRAITVTGDDAVLNNIALSITDDDVTVTGFTLNENNADFTTNGGAAIYVSGSGVTLDGVSVTYNAPDEVEAKAIFADGAENFELINSEIIFSGENPGSDHYRGLEVSNCDAAKIDNNTISAEFPAVPFDWVGSGIDQGLVIAVGIQGGENVEFTNNTVNVNTNGSVGSYPTIDAVMVHSANDILIKGNTITHLDTTPEDGARYYYSLDIYSTTGTVEANDITVNTTTDNDDDRFGTAYAIQVSGPLDEVTVKDNNLTAISKGPVAGIYATNWAGYTDLTVENNIIDVTGYATTSNYALVAGIEAEADVLQAHNNTITVANGAEYDDAYQVYGISMASPWFYSESGEQPIADIQDNIMTVDGQYAVYYTEAENTNVIGNYLISANLKGDAAVYIAEGSGNTVENNLRVVKEVIKDNQVDGYIVYLGEDGDNPSPDPLPDDANLVELTYSRTLAAPAEGSSDTQIDDKPANLFTVCLPFAPETGDEVKYYTLSDVSGETVYFDEVDNPVANTPYLIAVFGSGSFTDSCNKLEVSSMTINSTTVAGYTFNGTFTGMTNEAAQGKYVLQSDNKWGKVTAENDAAFIPPFRAFIEGPANGARLLSGSIDGSATGIKYIRTHNIDGTERYFDLNGRRIEKPATKGIYIHNGRKEVLK